MLLTVLIGRNQEITSNAFQKIEQKQTAIQSVVSLNDVIALLNHFSDTITDADSLDIFLKIPVLEINDPQSEISISFDCDHGSNKMHINSIMDRNITTKKVVKNETVHDFFMEILSYYNVLDSSFLMALFMDTIDTDNNERAAQSEIVLSNPFFRQGSIYNKAHLDHIIRYYVSITSDANIYNVPWEGLVQYHDHPADFNHVTPQLMNFILPYSNSVNEFNTLVIEDANESGRFSDDEITRMNQLGISFYEPLLQCAYSFNQFGYNYQISFLYDIRSKKAFRFEYKK